MERHRKVFIEEETGSVVFSATFDPFHIFILPNTKQTQKVQVKDFQSDCGRMPHISLWMWEMFMFLAANDEDDDNYDDDDDDYDKV